MESKTNEQNRNRLINIEKTGSCQRHRMGMSEMDRESKGTNFQLQNKLWG